MFFNKIELENSPISVALIGETFAIDPVFVSRKWLRPRSSQRAVEDRLDIITSHSFLLRAGRVNELNFEIPSELASLLEDILTRPLVENTGESDNSQVEHERFLLF